ncbi:MAG: MFS transporter [Planctomycetes bacterium]|nr:MFS transporter [Planctomycetota bacterium]
MKGNISVRLSIMMFLQFFIWGSWYVTAPSFLSTIGFTSGDFTWTYSVGPIAGILSPFIVGMIADRFFATERVLGVMHILAAAAMFGSTLMMDPSSANPDLINIAFFAHMLCFFPTLALTNSLAMHNMEDSEKQFPVIRVFGTIGWIVAGFLLGKLELGSTIIQFQMAAGAGLLLGLYSFTLPHTPPPLAGKTVSVRELLGLDALVLLKKPAYLVFMICSFLICIPLAFYYQMAERFVAQAGISEAPFKMTWGQFSEIAFMLAMPLCFRRLGVKWMLVVGMGAWVLRYGLFAGAAIDDTVWMILAGIVLHGICYDFFFVTGQIYTDKTAPEEIRGQAQGMLVFFTLGLGMLIGAQVAGKVEGANTPEASQKLNEEVKELGTKIEGLEKEAESAKGDKADELKKQIEELGKIKTTKSKREQQLKDWKLIWLMPALGALAVLVFFTAVFRDTPADEAVAEEEVAESAAREEQP